MREQSLAAYVPLWTTLRQLGVTALVTPAGDYVGALQLGTLDVRFASAEQADTIGTALRSFVGGLEDGCTLHFLYRVDQGTEADIREYEDLCAGAAGDLPRYVAGRASWLRERRPRRTTVYLFFSAARAGLAGAAGRGQLGVKLPFRKAETLTPERHVASLKKLAQLRDRVAGQLALGGILSRELDVEEVRRVHFALLNPRRARDGARPTAVHLREDLWGEEVFKEHGDYLREYSEAEQLAHEDVEDARGYFCHGGLFRRVATLKMLPENGTPYFAATPLLQLALAGGDYGGRPFAYWLAVTAHVESQGKKRRELNRANTLVRAMKGLLGQLKPPDADQDAADRARQDAIQGLFEELNTSSAKIVALSASLLLEAEKLEELDAQTEAARTAFGRCGNSEMAVEDVTQIPAFLSMLPGAGRYQLRKKGGTSLTAADFLPLYAPWRGTAKPYSLLLTPSSDLVRLDLFDKGQATAHHGLVVGETGSGKSVTLGFLTLEARAAGIEAVMIDNGGSWKNLTELFGGTHIEVDLNTSISPFQEYAAIRRPDAEDVENEEVENAALFLEVCLQDTDLAALSNRQSDVLQQAIRWCYREKLRHEPQRRPLVGDFRDALLAFPWEHADDKAIRDDLVQRLRLFCEGLYGAFLNRPSNLRFDAELMTLDLQHVSQKPMTKRIAMAAVMQALTNRARHRQKRTLIEVDEGHEYLGDGEAVERYLGSAYRKMRKFNCAMWIITQQLGDLIKSKVGDAIIGNSSLKIMLRHSSNRDVVADYFKFSPGAREAFDQLSMKAGYYSDLLLSYGAQSSVVRLALHPLAYWILTTDPEDKAVRERAFSRNPGMSRIEVLEHLAARYPHGVVGRVAPPRRSVA